MLTRIFRSGNSQAVRIPKELAFDADTAEVLIERRGNALVIRPFSQRSFDGLLQALRAFPPGFLAEGRGIHEQKERDWHEGKA